MIFYVFACAYTQRGELNMPMICHAAPQRYPSIVGRHDPHLAFTCLFNSFPSTRKSISNYFEFNLHNSIFT